METAQHSYFAKKYAPKALHFCLKTQLKGVIIMKKKILAQQPSIEWISSLHTDKCDKYLILQMGLYQHSIPKNEVFNVQIWTHSAPIFRLNALYVVRWKVRMWRSALFAFFFFKKT